MLCPPGPGGRVGTACDPCLAGFGLLAGQRIGYGPDSGRLGIRWWPGAECAGLVLAADPAQVPCGSGVAPGQLEGDWLEHGLVVAIVLRALPQRVAQVGSPLRGAHQTGLNQREPVEEPFDVGAATRDQRRVPVQVLGHAEQRVGRLGMGFAGHVAQGQVAARRHRIPELPDDPARVFPVPQAVQHAHEHDPKWP